MTATPANVMAITLWLVGFTYEILGPQVHIILHPPAKPLDSLAS
jgi:hypothetical protein